jgi:GT2 family glycosyltransferase/glycosyltransferase involved in cell wall biosynthesis
MRTEPVSVSVILVNFCGASDTLVAIEYLRLVDYPAGLLEIIVVDNASDDDSVEVLRAAVQNIVLVESTENTGFAAGCNLGVRHSTGRIVAFLNNDARPDPSWVAAAVDAFASSPQIGAVASKVLDWDGNKVDFIGSGLTWFGMGYKPFTAELPPRIPDVSQSVLFGTGSAMFVRRDVFDELGGFDEDFFMFFEDVDFGWRLNLRGWRYLYEPASLAYHKHHATMDKFAAYREDYFLERNALFALFKNFENATLNEALPASMALAARRSIAKGGVDSGQFDVRVPGGDGENEIEVPKVTMSGVFAIDRFVEALPKLRSKRAEIQRTRVVSDRELWPLFGLTDLPAYESDSYLEGYEEIVTTFDVVATPARKNVLIITGDPFGCKLAGPAIRAWNIATALQPKTPVRLLTLSGIEDGFEGGVDLVHVAPGDEDGFAEHEAWADIIIFQGHAMVAFERLSESKKIIVVDIYDPMQLEQLEQGKALGPEAWTQAVEEAGKVLNQQLARGDFFLAASERQRAFWLGQLAGLGRLNPANYEHDPHLRGLIAVVPFGMSALDPQHRRPVLKGMLPGIADDAKLIIWSGGLYDWFDPATLIRAVAELATRRPNVALYFQGTKHPHPGVPEMPIVAAARALADDLGVLNRTVFFNGSWVDYADRENYLTEADVGVSTHFAHIETEFSFRTRILDYLWADLPMVVTRGDHFGDLIERERLGIAVPPQNVPELAAALERALFDSQFIAEARSNIGAPRGR